MSVVGGAVLGAHDILRRLYPTPLDPPRSGRTRRFLAVPGHSDPRMFLPASQRRLAGAALRNARRSTAPMDLVRTVAASSAVALGASRLLGARVDVAVAGSVEEELERLLGHPVTVSVFVGPPRANRKPVLQVFDDRSRPVAVAKVGIDELTVDLAATEARALRRLGEAELTTVAAPRLVAEHLWRDLPVVVQSYLDVPLTPVGPDPQQLVRAVTEIAALAPRTAPPLAGSPLLDRMAARVELMADHPGARRLARQVMARLREDHRPLPLGAWHGDLTPFNLAVDGERVLVWDWERFDTQVPIGFDLLHHTFLPRLNQAGRPEEVATELLASSPELLSGLDVDRSRAPVTATLYLLEVATRFSGDGQAATGTVAGDVERWLAPALIQVLENERR